MTVNPSNGDIYIWRQDIGTISVISKTSVVATLSTGTSGQLVNEVYDSSDGYIYVVGSNPNPAPPGDVGQPLQEITVISGTKEVANITQWSGSTLAGNLIAGYFLGGTYDPSHGYVYFPTTNGVFVISGTSVITELTKGGLFRGSQALEFAYDPANGYVYGVNGAIGGYVTAISGTSIVAQIPLNECQTPCSGTSSEAVVNQYSGLVYVPAGNSIYVISNATIIAKLPSLFLSSSTAYDPSNHYLYFVNRLSPNTVSVLSGTSIIANMSVSSPGTPVVDPSTGNVYVQSGAGDQLTEISGTTVLGAIPIGSVQPGQFMFDQFTGYAYLSNGVNTYAFSTGGSTAQSSTVSSSPTVVATTSSSTAAATSSNSSGGGGVPEFPYQLLTAVALTTLLAVAYLVVRLRAPARV